MLRYKMYVYHSVNGYEYGGRYIKGIYTDRDMEGDIYTIPLAIISL